MLSVSQPGVEGRGRLMPSFRIHPTAERDGMQVEDSCGGALSINHPLGLSQHRPLTSAPKSLFSAAINRLLPTGSNSCAVSREE
jgi:hypothetical protein